MASFQRGETIICSVEVKNAAGTYIDPATSMKITILDPLGVKQVDDQSMTKDDVGKYHRDWTSSATASLGTYKSQFKATDGSRISREDETFEVVE